MTEMIKALSQLQRNNNTQNALGIIKELENNLSTITTSTTTATTFQKTQLTAQLQKLYSNNN